MMTYLEYFYFKNVRCNVRYNEIRNKRLIIHWKVLRTDILFFSSL